MSILLLMNFRSASFHHAPNPNPIRPEVAAQRARRRPGGNRNNISATRCVSKPSQRPGSRTACRASTGAACSTARGNRQTSGRSPGHRDFIGPSDSRRQYRRSCEGLGWEVRQERWPEAIHRNAIATRGTRRLDDANYPRSNSPAFWGYSALQCSTPNFPTHGPFGPAFDARPRWNGVFFACSRHQDCAWSMAVEISNTNADRAGAEGAKGGVFQ